MKYDCVRRYARQKATFAFLPLLIMAGGKIAVAQEVPEASQPDDVLEEITVTGSRTGASLRDITTSVSIVDEESLATQFALASNVLQMLDVAVPGLNVGTRDVRQAGCSSTLRGRVPSFQINGIPVNQDLRRSSCNGMFQVSPFALERVEVVRGSTALYGAGAPGGIVNLITRRASSEDLEVDTVVQFGFNPQKATRSEEFNVYAGIGQIVGNWDYYGGVAVHQANAGRNPDGGYVFLTERDDYSFSGSVGYEMPGIGRLRLTGTFYTEELGDQWWPDGDQFFGVSNVVEITPHPDRENAEDRLYTVGMTFERDQIFGHRLLLSGYVQDQRYKQRDNFFDKNGPDWGFPADFFFATDADNQRQGIRSTLSRNFAFRRTELELEYGLDFVHQHFYRPEIDTDNNNAIIGFVAPDTNLDTYSAFVQSAMDLGRWRLTGGLRHETYRGWAGSKGFDAAIPSATPPGDFDDDSLLLGNAGVILNFSNGLQAYAGFSQGAELSELSRAARGVDDPGLVSLEPATSNQYEVGLRGGYGPLFVTAAVYYSHSDLGAELQPDPSCAGEPICPLIPLRVKQRIHGMEGSVDWDVSSKLQLGAIFTYQQGEIFEPDLERFVDFNSEVISPVRTTGYIEFAPIERWRNRIQATYAGAIDQFTPAEQGIGRINSESTFLADFSSSYDIGRGAITLSVSNLFNEKYVSVTNQGRSFGFYSLFEEGTRITLGYRARY